MKLAGLSIRCLLAAIVIGIALLLLFRFFAATGPVFDFTVFKWKYVGDNMSVVESVDGNRLIGPGFISLWCRHPYVFGSCIETPVCSSAPFFVLDLKSGRLERFSDDEVFKRFGRLGLDINQAIGIGTLMASPDRVQIRRTLENSVKRMTD